MTHAMTHAHDTNTEMNDDRSVGDSASNTPTGSDNTRLERAAAALVAGLVVLVVVFASLDRVAVWAAEHGPVWVYLGFFLVMSIAGRLFWWGMDTLVKQAAAWKPGSGR
ncbi:hypothetical protein AB4Z09_28575 [Rhodococcus sp. TAF43]|uniref:hypothetical protein n=1 Tax=Rhodococcus sp. TAF43 TaxID=3237483 RepID=UPI003F974994